MHAPVRSAATTADAGGEAEPEKPRGASILLLGSYAPSLLNFRGPLIAALTANGHRVLAAAPDIDSAVADGLRALGAEPLPLRLSNASLDPVGLYRSLRELRRLLRRHRPDVIISYTIKPVILGALAGRAEGVPRIVALVTGVGFAFTDGGKGLARTIVRLIASRLYRAAFARSDMVLFQNPDDQALFRQLGLLGKDHPSAVVNGSGVDLDHFAPAALPGATSFLMIARLLGNKGVREFAAAARKLLATHPEFPVALVGYLDPSPDSLTQGELDALIASGIRFLGRLEDVRPAIAACSVYVLPSYREGTPRSVLEAMAMGRAVITTDAPGCRETVIEGVNGFLVPPRNADALYAAMKRFVDRPELAGLMGAQSRILAERKYDARQVSAEIMRHALGSTRA